MKQLKEFNLLDIIIFICVISGIIVFNPRIGIASFIDNTTILIIIVFSILYYFINFFFRGMTNKFLNIFLLLLLFVVKYIFSVSKVCILIPPNITLEFLLKIWGVYKSYIPHSVFFYLGAGLISILFFICLNKLREKNRNFCKFSFINIGIFCAIIDLSYLFINDLPILNGNLRPVILNVFYGAFLQFICMIILWVILFLRGGRQRVK